MAGISSAGRRRHSHEAGIAPSLRWRCHAHETRMASSWRPRNLLSRNLCDGKSDNERGNQDPSNRYRSHWSSPSLTIYIIK